MQVEHSTLHILWWLQVLEWDENQQTEKWDEKIKLLCSCNMDSTKNFIGNTQIYWHLF